MDLDTYSAASPPCQEDTLVEMALKILHQASPWRKADFSDIACDLWLSRKVQKACIVRDCGCFLVPLHPPHSSETPGASRNLPESALLGFKLSSQSDSCSSPRLQRHARNPLAAHLVIRLPAATGLPWTPFAPILAGYCHITPGIPTAGARSTCSRRLHPPGRPQRRSQARKRGIPKVTAGHASRSLSHGILGGCVM